MTGQRNAFRSFSDLSSKIAIQNLKQKNYVKPRKQPTRCLSSPKFSQVSISVNSFLTLVLCKKYLLCSSVVCSKSTVDHARRLLGFRVDVSEDSEPELEDSFRSRTGRIRTWKPKRQPRASQPKININSKFIRKRITPCYNLSIGPNENTWAAASDSNCFSRRAPRRRNCRP
jgi:hypothetical protein